MKNLITLISVGVTTLLAGCVNVEPADRGTLASSGMQLDPIFLDANFTDHAFYSREGTAGAYANNAGGCGCN